MLNTNYLLQETSENQVIDMDFYTKYSPFDMHSTRNRILHFHGICIELLHISYKYSFAEDHLDTNE